MEIKIKIPKNKGRKFGRGGTLKRYFLVFAVIILAASICGGCAGNGYGYHDQYGRALATNATIGGLLGAVTGAGIGAAFGGGPGAAKGAAIGGRVRCRVRIGGYILSAVPAAASQRVWVLSELFTSDSTRADSGGRAARLHAGQGGSHSPAGTGRIPAGILFRGRYDAVIHGPDWRAIKLVQLRPFSFAKKRICARIKIVTSEQ